MKMEWILLYRCWVILPIIVPRDNYYENNQLNDSWKKKKSFDIENYDGKYQPNLKDALANAE